MDILRDHNWVLSVGTFLPLAGVLVMLFIPKAEEQLQKAVALITALATLGVGVYTLTLFNYDRAGEMQFVAQTNWISVIKSTYYIGIDGISLPLYILSMVITVLVMIYSWDHIPSPGNPKAFLMLMLVLQTGMAGTFISQDLILFFVFFELVLLPMYFMIGVWGGENRQYASLKFFLYTMFGSALMLVAFLALFFKTGAESFAIPYLVENGGAIAKNTQVWIFAGMFIGFAVKVPMFPFHTWLPDAHTQAPTQGSVILAAVLLKLGTYGFIRIAIPMLPDAAREWAPYIGLLAVIGIIYGALGCLAQTDMKRLIAFSSVAHMGFVTLGSFLVFDIAANTGDLQGAGMGIDGAMVQMVSHGLISGAMFLCVGVLYDRLHSREISAYGGVINRMPMFGAFMVLFAMANSGLPGTSGFVGEFLVIIASFKANFWYAFLAATTLILGAAYTLWLVKRVIFGPVANDGVATLDDLNGREFLILGVLAVAVLLLGIWPAPLLELMQASVQHLVEQIVTSKLPL